MGMGNSEGTPNRPPAVQLLDNPAVLEFRKLLQSCETKGWEHFDDLAFKISAGGLALSLTLLGIMKNVAPTSIAWMFVAWVCWAVSLLALMLSISTAQSGLRSQIRHLDMGDYYELQPGERPEGMLGGLTSWLNHFVTGTSMLGLICLMVFALMNMAGRK
jgi:hypothetical protein